MSSQGSRRWVLPVLGILVFHLCQLWSGREESLWLPGLGVGIALFAWSGWSVLPLLVADAALIRWFGDFPASRIWFDPLLLGFEISLSWWLYHNLARGSLRLNDPRSATLFLLLAPAFVGALAAILQVFVWQSLQVSPGSFEGMPLTQKFGNLWINRGLGILILTPGLLAVLSPVLAKLRLLPADIQKSAVTTRIWQFGDALEIAGLAFGNSMLGIALVHLQREGFENWPLWGVSLLLIVWSSLRQGLSGGSIVSGAGGIVAMTFADHWSLSAGLLSPFQGNLLAQSTITLLVGASAGWIRASEARYRQIVGHMPVVLYSVHVPGGLKIGPRAEGSRQQAYGPTIAGRAEVTLVSPACRKIMGCEPAELEGAYQRWLDRILPEDLPLLTAALSQLCLQKQPVVCEYRVQTPPDPTAGVVPPPSGSIRWVRDTLAPFYIESDLLRGWEGVVEDITEARALAQNFRRTSNMFQALISNLPTGVFFVTGPHGQPILANVRARKLLGQREDLAGGFEHIPSMYRLFKPDGLPYPAEELPVARALKLGTNQMANDIVLHRPDGRRIPLITWAAPIDLGGRGEPDAAVWVLEDWSALHLAETARKDTEVRLRAIIETMAEGVLVLNQAGTIVECNPAACHILQVKPAELLGKPSISLDANFVREDGNPLEAHESVERRLFQAREPIRNVILGLVSRQENAGPTRWLLANAIPLPVGQKIGSAGKDARLVVTFADITENRRVEKELHRTQQLELVGRIASGTVHDFNNLLTVMIGLADMAQRDLEAKGNPNADTLRKIIEIGEQASHLAGQILALGKMKPAEGSTVDLNVLVLTAVKLLQAALPDNIRVESALAPENLLIQGDENLFKQVFLNLGLNARDAMPAGGTLTLATRNSDGRAHLSIQDTGHGMEPATQARIFEPFFSTKIKGTGLGLVVVQQIIENFGGTVECRSQPGEGTRFDIAFKLVTAQP